MNRSHINYFSSSRRRSIRVLAALLFVCFSWGALGEFSHHHGSSRTTREPAAKQTPGYSFSDGSIASIGSDQGDFGSSSTRNRDECLICQLHQNLSATALAAHPGIGSTVTYVPFTLAAVIVPQSEFTTVQHGRAPPTQL